MKSEFPLLKTERLLLRQFSESDLDNVFLGLSHPEVIKYYGISYDTRESAKKQLEFFADLEKNGTGMWWAVCSRDNKTFYGAGGLNNVNRINKKAEIGFWLMPEYWHKGIMQEAFPVICKFGFANFSLHRIEGFVEPQNALCKRALERLRFNHEGTMKDCEFKKNQFISLDIYALFYDLT